MSAELPAVLAVDVEPFSDEELDDVLAFVESSGVPTEVGSMTSDTKPVAFIVDDDSTAEWAARKWATETSEVTRIGVQASEWRAKIDAWEATESKKARGRAAFFEGHLLDFLRRRRAESEFVKRDGTVDWRVKSIVLPSAVLKSSAQRDRVRVADSEDAEVAAVGWCEANGHESAVKRSLLVSQLKDVVSASGGAVVSADGEVVPGLVVEPASVSYRVVQS